MHNQAKALSILFNIGYWTFFWGAFEQAHQNGDAIWSTLFGAPIPHHWLIGAAITYTVYLYTTLRERRKTQCPNAQPATKPSPPNMPSGCTG